VVVSVPTGDERTLAEGEKAAFTLDGAEVIFSQGPRVLAIPRDGGAPRLLAELPGAISDLKIGPDRTIHLSLRVADDQQAWRIAGGNGAVERDAPAPWTEIVPAPAGGWRAALVGEPGGVVAAHLFPPGAGLDDPPAHVVRARARPGSLAWDWSGRSVVYFDGQAMHRFDIATGADVVVVRPAQALGLVAPSPDEELIYTNDLVSHVRRQLIVNYGSVAGTAF